MATLNLPDGYRTAVWRVLREAIEADPVWELADVRLSFFDGDPRAIEDLDAVQGPVLQFFPTCGASNWFDERSQSGSLAVNVEARAPRLDVEDVFNLQEALEGSLQTVGTRGLDLQTDLAEVGATTGLIVFSQPLRPAPGKPGGDHLFRLIGQFVVEVLLPQ